MKGGFKQQLWMGFGIVIAATMVAAAALYFLAGDLDAQAAKIVTDKTLLARQTTVISVLANLKSDAVKAAVYKVALDKLLPTHDGLIGFSQWLGQIGSAHSVSPTVSFTGNNMPANDTTPASDGFSLNAAGSAADLVAFLDDLEVRSPGFLLAIDSFTFVSQGGTYQLSAQGRLFSQ